MANNVIDLNKEVSDLVELWKKHNTELLKAVDYANQLGKSLPKKPSDVSEKVDVANNNIVNIKKQSIDLTEKQRLSEIKLQKAREKAFDDYERELKKEQQLLANAQNLYSKVEAKLRTLQNEYKGLATKKELGLRLSIQEEKQYSNLQARIQKYDTILKGVDATMGKYQRNVGNYASAFNPLSNSINQLTREMVLDFSGLAGMADVYLLF